MRLTPAGILAVNEYGGDLGAWRTATGPGSMTVNAGDHVQATMNSSHVTQVQHLVATGTGEVDVAKYRREAGEQLRKEMDAPSPDHARARVLAARVLQILGALTISGAGSYIVELLSGGAL